MLNTLIYRVVRTNIKKDNLALRFSINNSYVTCNRKRSLTTQFSCKWMIVNWVASLASHEQSVASIELFNQFSAQVLYVLRNAYQKCGGK